MTSRRRNWAGYVLVSIALVVLLSEWVRTSWFNHHAETWVLMFGIVLGFVGFFIIDPTHAEQGAGFVVSSATSLIQVVRSGRRSTDTVVVSETINPKATTEE